MGREVIGRLLGLEVGEEEVGFEVGALMSCGAGNKIELHARTAAIELLPGPARRGAAPAFSCDYTD